MRKILSYMVKLFLQDRILSIIAINTPDFQFSAVHWSVIWCLLGLWHPILCKRMSPSHWPLNGVSRSLRILKLTAVFQWTPQDLQQNHSKTFSDTQICGTSTQKEMDSVRVAPKESSSNGGMERSMTKSWTETASPKLNGPPNRVTLMCGNTLTKWLILILGFLELSARFVLLCLIIYNIKRMEQALWVDTKT